MAKNKLGRGFDVLIPKDLDVSIFEEDKNRVQKLLITDVFPNPDQPRREFSKTELNELKDSIKRHGVLQPLIVVRHEDNKYKIVAGERRWRAAKDANLSHIPAIIRSLEELEQLEIALIENIQRVDLNPLEQAVAIYRLQQQFGLALDQVAKRLGKAPSTVSNVSRLLHLSDSAKQALNTGQIGEGHARAILALKGNSVKQEELLQLILKNNWTVRQAEQFALAAKRGESVDKAVNKTIATTPLTEKISKKLKAEVLIKRKAKGGQLLINYTSDKDLERIAKFFDL